MKTPPPEMISRWREDALKIVTKPNVYPDSLFDKACAFLRQHGVV